MDLSKKRYLPDMGDEDENPLKMSNNEADDTYDTYEEGKERIFITSIYDIAYRYWWEYYSPYRDMKMYRTDGWESDIGRQVDECYIHDMRRGPYIPYGNNGMIDGMRRSWNQGVEPFPDGSLRNIRGDIIWSP